MSLKEVVLNRLNENELSPREHLGQHFLIDDDVLKTIVSHVSPDADVLEVGSGIGQVSEALAERANKVVGVEIDRRYQDILEMLIQRYPNLSFIYKDILALQLKNLVSNGTTQVVANLPFHITEPFLQRLIDLPVTSVSLILGQRAAEELVTPVNRSTYGRLSMVGQTFFDIEILRDISRDAFYPIPRTDASLVMMTPKDSREISYSLPNFIFAQLFRRMSKHGLVINDLKQAIVDGSISSKFGISGKRETWKKERANVKRQTKDLIAAYNSSGEDAFVTPKRDKIDLVSQGQAMRVIESLGLDPKLLGKPFASLDNVEIRQLANRISALR